MAKKSAIAKQERRAAMVRRHFEKRKELREKVKSPHVSDEERESARIALNKMLTNSQIFDSVWDNQKYDAMLTFGWRKGKWTVSLYSDKDDIDVGIIAKGRGGGGHKGAAGFQVDVLPFNLNKE